MICLNSAGNLTQPEVKKRDEDTRLYSGSEPMGLRPRPEGSAGWFRNQTNSAATNRQLIGAVPRAPRPKDRQGLEVKIIQSKARLFAGQWTIAPRSNETLRPSGGCGPDP